YENQLYDEARKENEVNNFLRISLSGGKENYPINGVKLIVYYGGDKKGFYEQSVYRGYLSSVEKFAHFGLGKSDIVDSLLVVWPDGMQQKLTKLAANQVLEISYDN